MLLPPAMAPSGSLGWDGYASEPHVSAHANLPLPSFGYFAYSTHITGCRIEALTIVIEGTSDLGVAGNASTQECPT